MKIVQISDFHLNKCSNFDDYQTQLEKFVEVVKSQLKNNEEIIICSCGDIIDKGDTEGYDIACRILNYLKTEFSGYVCNLEFVPGNHDFTNQSEIEFSKFDEFIGKYNAHSYSYSSNSINVKQYGDFDLVLINTIYHKDINYGKIDLSSLKQELSKHKDNLKLLVMHHTIVSEYEDDTSSIRAAHEFINLIKEYNVAGLLHGHTHGYSGIVIGEQCEVVGVGPIFKEVSGVAQQFNLLDVSETGIDSITNYRYGKDIKEYVPNQVYIRNKNNVFIGDNASAVYRDILKCTKKQTCLNNLHVSIKTNYDKFIEDMERNFKQELKIAEQWQNSNIPDTLYYNHGQYIHKNGRNGIEYIIEQLKEKATSSRALIPLISIDDVIDSGDDFLPSLDIIQVGFEDDAKNNIYITIYLRALEVGQFLKINLSEIYLILKQIKAKIGSVNQVVITINAFRSQYKEKFSCFKKALIDKYTEAKITSLFYSDNIEELIQLLDEKKELQETVVHKEGIQNLYEAAKVYLEGRDDKSNLLSNIEKLIDYLKKMEETVKKTSRYRETESLQGEINKQIDQVISSLKEIQV